MILETWKYSACEDYNVTITVTRIQSDSTKGDFLVAFNYRAC